ncbi:MAG: hypothetical protein H7A51_08645 [Akkermansiaceae bacterium]|nr:hypothetical protein [Akkermansiaceae bacterium]
MTRSKQIITRIGVVIEMMAMAGTSVVVAQEPDDGNHEARHGHGPGIPRLRPQPEPRTDQKTAKPAQPPADRPSVQVEFPNEFRNIDGTNNNLENTYWGSAEQTYLRRLPARYADDADSPAGSERPNARAVSNAVAMQTGSVENRRGASDFLWQWGQFLDHDINETPGIDPVESFNIEIPAGDPWFDPQGTGEAIIPLNRSLYEHVKDVRQQINAITAYIDASNVYGSDDTRAFALRRLDGSGKLKTSDTDQGELLPYNTTGMDNAPTSSADYFLAGDVRANEQTGLTAMHTLFVREHNHHADEYKKLNPSSSDEETYQYARMIVVAEMQAITYREFLPILIGRDAIRPYDGYKPQVNAGISNVFACAAYRFGHSLIPSTLLRLDENGAEVAAGNLSLADAFFNPGHIENEGIDSIIRGLAGQRCQELDSQIVDDLRNFLFGPPGAGGLDLAALNIQRGRDHGLPSYNETRKALGLRPARDFMEITRDPVTARRLAEAYGNVNEIDLWVGALCEPHLPGTMVGEMLHHLLRDQFMRLRDGDRFWYQGYLPEVMRRMVEQQTLATIIRRNTDIGDELPDNVFLAADAPAEPPAPPRPGERPPRRGR